MARRKARARVARDTSRALDSPYFQWFIREIVYCPVPVRVTFFRLPEALSVIVTEPLWLPVDVGVYVMLMVQLAPPATEDPQVLV